MHSGLTLQRSGSGLLHRKAPCTRHFRSSQPRRAPRRVAETVARGLGALLNLPAKSITDRPPVKPHKVAPALEVPKHIPRPEYAANKGTSAPAGFQIHNGKGLKKMRAACQLAARVLQYAGTLVKEGVTTDHIDRQVHQMIIENGAYPSPLNYGGFPKSVCTSVNEVMCHGIPDSRQLLGGDILNIDVTVYLNGYHGDTSAMFYVGEVSAEAQRLCEVTKLAMEEGIQQCRPGVKVSSIGKAIQECAKRHRLAVVPDFVGHGVGRTFHAEPLVVPIWTRDPEVMQAGQTFTVEPILVTGRPRIHMWKDDWTAVAADGGLAAQWEHTVLITPSGHEVLTVPGAEGSSKGF